MTVIRELHVVYTVDDGAERVTDLELHNLGELIGAGRVPPDDQNVVTYDHTLIVRRP